MRSLTLLSVSALIIAMGVAQGLAKPKEEKGIRLVDGKGRLRALLSCPDDGEPALEFYSTDGRTVSRIGVSAGGYATDGQPREESGVLVLSGAQGYKISARPGPYSARLTIQDDKGNETVSLTSSPEEGQTISVFRPGGVLAASLSVGQVHTTDKSGQGIRDSTELRLVHGSPEGESGNGQQSTVVSLHNGVTAVTALDAQQNITWQFSTGADGAVRIVGGALLQEMQRLLAK